MTQQQGFIKRTSFRDEQQHSNHADPEATTTTTTTAFGKLSSFRDEMAADVKEGSITYGHQSELPRLPIPTLQETMTKFPTVLQALQNEVQQAETQRVVQEFWQGPGPALQQALEDYQAEGFAAGEFGSYVEEFWNEAYLAPDSSVVLNLNPFFVLEGGVG